MTDILVVDILELLEPIDLDELPYDEQLFYGKHAYMRDPNQVSVWELYDVLSPGGYHGRHRDDGYYDRMFGEPMVLWSPFFGTFIRHNMTSTGDSKVIIR